MKKTVINYWLIILEGFLGIALIFFNYLKVFPYRFIQDFQDAATGAFALLLFLSFLELVNLYRTIWFKKVSGSIPYLLFILYSDLIMAYFKYYDFPSNAILLFLLIAIFRISEICYMRSRKLIFIQMYSKMLYLIIFDTLSLLLLFMRASHF